MKWVKTKVNTYKLVEDSDERPEYKLKDRGIFDPSHVHIKFDPTWKKYEEAMTHPDSKNQGEATDKFIAEREFAMKTDPKAKRWEESRRERLAKDKPAWRKEMMRREEW